MGRFSNDKVWIDTRSSIDNTLHEKASETGDDDRMCYVFILEDAVTNLSVTDLSSTLRIEK